MKQIVLTIALAFILSSCSTSYYTYQEPVHVTGRVNIAVQPAWGPAGYDYALYYYFPDFDFYYDVERALFYYHKSGRWVSAKILPRNGRYPTDLYRYYKVVINSHNPWLNNRHHRTQYKQYKGKFNQPNLRDSHGGKDYRQDPRSNDPRRIPYQGVTPPRNNNSRPGSQPSYNRGENTRPGNNVGQRPGSSSRPNNNVGQRPGSSTRPGNNVGQRPGNSSRPNNNVGQRPGNSSRPGVGTPPSNNSSRPSSTRPNTSQGGSKGSNKSGSSSKQSTKSSSSSTKSSSSTTSSTGSRSTGSRGR